MAAQLDNDKLVYAFINVHFNRVDKKDKQLPIELMDLCVLFYNQNMPSYSAGHKCMIDAKNKTIATDGSMGYYKSHVIFQVAWNKGIHELRFKCIDGFNCCYSIGIVSNKDANPDDWLFDHKEANVSYQLYSSRPRNYFDKPGIYFHEHGTRKWSKPTKRLTNGCIVSFIANFVDWTIQYVIDGEEMGEPIEIKQNMTYYPAIAFNNNDTMKCKLLCCTSCL